MVDAIKYPLNVPGILPEDVKRPEGPHSEWASLKCRWKKITGRDEEGNTIISDNNELDVIVNCKTEKVYNNDPKNTLRAKFAALTVGTPYILTAKIIYHLFLPLSLGLEIRDTVKKVQEEKAKALENGKEPPKDLAQRIVKVIGRNLADIVRTPLYAVAMAITALATLILSIFKSSMLYHGRVLYGEMLMSLNWGEKNTIWTIAPCMQPLAELKKHEKKKDYVMPDTVYDDVPGTKMHALNNMARSHFNQKETKCDKCLEKMENTINTLEAKVTRKQG